MDRHEIKRRAATEKIVPKINIINDDILCYILTFLPLKEAVRTSILARSWRNRWKFNPNLIVKYPDGINIDNMPNSNTIISNILDSHKTKLQCCQIRHGISDINQGRVLQWITRLRESHHVQDLTLKTFCDKEYLKFCTPVFDMQLSPPSKLFGSQTLQVLKLSHYVLRDGSAFEGCVNLTTLKLQDVKIFSSRTTIAEIIANCPQLTNLSLTHWADESRRSMAKDLTLCSDKLEYLELRQESRILSLYIDAVKLRSLVLEFRLSVGDTYINTPVLTSFRLLDNLGSRFLRYPLGLTTTKRFRHKGLENLHYLSVVMGLSYQIDDELLCRIFQVCLHLKELHIVNYHRLQDFGGPLAQENIRENDEPILFWDDDKIESIFIIRLRALEVSMFRADRLEMEFVRYVMSYADQLELLVLRYDKLCSRQVIDAANKILLAHPRASGTAAIKLRLEES
ncbi:F-box/FBD/LRR-repeat protein At5g56420-like [Silene latifolia]|uniref:F-box/FBD/LRR-repeat protein At5g56420-like n=1 Tax=Silene latifolia TaxID=37657 RepID=UPI003D78A24A